jgi:hypothetical protein
LRRTAANVIAVALLLRRHATRFVPFMHEFVASKPSEALFRPTVMRYQC